jgi:hypothetical protein
MRLVTLFLLLACLVAAGCTSNDKNSQDNRFGGFYGGVNGGGAP